MTALAAVPESELDRYGRIAREAHERGETLEQDQREEWITAGKALSAAKAKLGHGKWLPWLARNFPASEDTAEFYVKVARNSERVRNLPPGISRRAVDRELSRGTRARDEAVRYHLVACLECGYGLYATVECLSIAVPDCPRCKAVMTVADPGVAIEAGVLGLDDLGRERTAVCRAHGWTDAIVRRSPGRRSPVRQCQAAGCTLFALRSRNYCPKHDHHDGMPF